MLAQAKTDGHSDGPNLNLKANLSLDGGMELLKTVAIGDIKCYHSLAAQRPEYRYKADIHTRAMGQLSFLAKKSAQMRP
jgi:hypothetical protein